MFAAIRFPSSLRYHSSGFCANLPQSAERARPSNAMLARAIVPSHICHFREYIVGACYTMIMPDTKSSVITRILLLIGIVGVYVGGGKAWLAAASTPPTVTITNLADGATLPA